jgi:hypothetical protein
LDITSPLCRTGRDRFLHEVDQSRSVHRYYAPLRLPSARPESLRLFGYRFPVPWCFLRSFTPQLEATRRVPGRLSQPDARSGIFPRRQTTLPSSRVTPLEACPALRPRWCPGGKPPGVAPGYHSPGLLPSARCRTSAFTVTPLDVDAWLILRTTTIQISGLNHAAYFLATPSFAHPLTTNMAAKAPLDPDKDARGFATDLPASL